MTPSATASCSTLTPSRLAARSRRIARTSAPARRNAVPLFSTDWLPAVWPSSGVWPVSPEISLMRPSGRSISSATICLSAVRMAWPSSTLPVNTVAVPSALMRIQPSSLRLFCRLPGRRSGPAASFGSREKATTSAPKPAVNWRRLKAGAFMSGPPVGPGGAQHRANDAVMGAAAAEIACERRAHIRLVRLRIAVEQLLGRHDHAVGTVAALRGLLLDEGGLQRMRIRDRAEPFDGGDLARRYRADRGDAGARCLAVDQHGAGAALRQSTAELGAVELEIVAQHVEQRRVGLGRDRAAHAVDFEIDRHTASPRSGRPPQCLIRAVLFCAAQRAPSRP